MKKIFSLLLISVIYCHIYSQVPFNQNPDWVSTDITNVSTGGAFADIDQDGWLDLVVANGNDMARQKVVVYYNNGTGIFSTTPDWQSADIDYHGHLDVGDVNADGYPDVAVSVYIGPSGFGSPGKVKLYLNNNGILSSNPDWISGDLVYTFSCAFGDADGDADLDLAVAGGESYNNNPEQPRIYYNIGGMLESLPSWKATASQYSYDVDWADFDRDGDLDVVFAGESYPNRIFSNNNGIISLTPTWQSTDASQYANSLFTGDINNDGFLDLAISDNNQLGGTGKFKIYLNNNGTLNTTPFWSSNFSGYGSGINLCNVDDDEDKDLITGGWWQPMRIYLNNNGNFNLNHDYTSISTSVVETIICGDINNDATIYVQETFISNGINKLFYFSRSPLHKILRIIVGPDTLQNNQYSSDLENGWIMLATQPGVGVEVKIKAIVSSNIEIGITNWDNNKGNYLFLNTLPPKTFQLTVNVHNGWNMLSIPGNHPDGNTLDNWYPYRDTTANTFRFHNGYQVIDTLTPGEGFWLKHLGARTYNTGDEWPASGILIVPHNPINGLAGWNVIGGYDNVATVSGITTNPPGLLIPPVYKYSGGYQTATTIDPGYGYWIKLSGAGNIILPESFAKGNEVSVEYFKEDWGKITITDAQGRSYTLYSVKGEVNLNNYELPPAPPQGMFDIRFGSGRIAEDLKSNIHKIEMRGIEYPVKVNVEGMTIKIQDPTGEKISAILTINDELVIDDNSINVLKVTSVEEFTPEFFTLYQNYPNPFNPYTKIKFRIADTGIVKLKVYDVLGNEISALVNEQKQAGEYEVEFDGTELPSGVYFYKLEAGSFNDIKKMIILK